MGNASSPHPCVPAVIFLFACTEGDATKEGSGGGDSAGKTEEDTKMDSDECIHNKDNVINEVT